MTALMRQSRRILAERARSFRWAAAFLPRRAHDDAALLYAFCRAVDDAADESEDCDEAARALRLLGAALEGDAPDTLVEAVRERVLTDAVCQGAADDLLRGAWSDVTQVRIADDAELIRYAYRVAGTVGLMMCRVIGVTDPKAIPHAIDLGIAMQLTNICRDVREDACNGRVYLPATRLHAAGTSPEALIAGNADRAAVATVVHDVLQLAERFYASADAGLRFIPWRPRLAILVASRLYRAIGLQLMRHGADALAGRTIVGTWGKLRWVLSALAQWPFVSFRARYLRPHLRALHDPLAGYARALPQ